MASEIEGGIVVGHDGSEAASDAVRWAGGLAERLGEPLHVVRAWRLTDAPRPRTQEVGFVPPLADFEAAVRADLEEDVAALGLSGTVTAHTAHEGAAKALLGAAERASMLVVGRRGAGGFRGLGFGSTADQVASYASCPVVVVPVDPRDD